MEPQIRYCKTQDGVNIAYRTMGAGPPFVWMELPSHMQAEQKLRVDQWSMYEQLAQIFTLVRYDHRGFGLSDRNTADGSLEGCVNDLQAVIDNVGPEPCVLFAGGGFTSPVALTYAARHPERLTRLVLLLPFARIASAVAAQIDALFSSSDWRFISESVIRLALGWEDDAYSRSLAAFIREAATLEDFRAFWRGAAHWDVRDLLSGVKTPTLLMPAVENPMAGPDQTREIASLMPDARAAVVDGTTSAGRTAQARVAVVEFLLGAGAARAFTATNANPSGTAIILFADIVDSTALTERMGDAAFRERARALDASMRSIITGAGGAVIDAKTLGDGVLATFPAASQAIDAALRCASAGDEQSLPLHLGLHAGDVIREQNNVFGGAVNIASRISGLSAPGEVLVSDVVRALARTSASVTFEDRGEHALKGVAEPQRVYAVRAQGVGT